MEEFRKESDLAVKALEVAIPWHWAAGFDCSLVEPVNLRLPSPQFIMRGGLERIPEMLSWRAGDEEVLRYVETDEGWNRDWALLVREDWLSNFLRRERLAFLAGCYGERRVFGPDLSDREVFGWVDLGASALFADGDWKIQGYDVIWDRRSGKDPD
jgi:hypothetical protein